MFILPFLSCFLHVCLFLSYSLLQTSPCSTHVAFIVLGSFVALLLLCFLFLLLKRTFFDPSHELQQNGVCFINLCFPKCQKLVFSWCAYFASFQVCVSESTTCIVVSETFSNSKCEKGPFWTVRFWPRFWPNLGPPTKDHLGPEPNRPSVSFFGPLEKNLPPCLVKN